MKRCMIYPLILILLLTAGCISDNRDPSGSVEDEVFSESMSQQIALDHVRDMDHYKLYNATDLQLVETLALECPYCWQFTYEFDLVSSKDPDVIDRARTVIIVQEGQVVDVVYSQGSREMSDPYQEENDIEKGR